MILESNYDTVNLEDFQTTRTSPYGSQNNCGHLSYYEWSILISALFLILGSGMNTITQH